MHIFTIIFYLKGHAERQTFPTLHAVTVVSCAAASLHPLSLAEEFVRPAAAALAGTQIFT